MRVIVRRIVHAPQRRTAISQSGTTNPPARGCREKNRVETRFLYRLMSEGKFPASVQLGIRAVGWDAAEIDQWISERLRKRQ